MNLLPGKSQILDDCSHTDNKQVRKYKKEPQINTDEHRFVKPVSAFICVHLRLINFIGSARKIGGSYEQ
jgi:hypothetical protein